METNFYNEIEFETITLEVPRDVVAYSFIAQKSLTHLDLSYCEFSLREKSVFTEEQCRKLMEPRRRILYELHLDLPKIMESSLREKLHIADDPEQYEAFYLDEMFVCACVYTRNLTSCIINAITSDISKIEKLRRFLRVIKLLGLDNCRKTAAFLFENLIFILFPYCSDSNLVVEFSITLGFSTWIFYKESPMVISFILHHALQVRYNVWDLFEWGMDPINGCIFFDQPRNISTLLKYGAVLRFQPQLYVEALGQVLERRMIRRIIRKNIPHRRLFLLLQLLYYFYFHYQSWEGMLYIWRSIPDPCLSSSEIRFLFGNVISPARLFMLTEYYKFYFVEEIGDINDVVPRPLQHLCRITIRNALIWNYQLPIGIRQLKVPQLIRDYLNLRC